MSEDIPDNHMEQIQEEIDFEIDHINESETHINTETVGYVEEFDRIDFDIEEGLIAIEKRPGAGKKIEDVLNDQTDRYYGDVDKESTNRHSTIYIGDAHRIKDGFAGHFSTVDWIEDFRVSQKHMGIKAITGSNLPQKLRPTAEIIKVERQKVYEVHPTDQDEMEDDLYDYEKVYTDYEYDGYWVEITQQDVKVEKED